MLFQILFGENLPEYCSVGGVNIFICTGGNVFREGGRRFFVLQLFVIAMNVDDEVPAAEYVTYAEV